MRDSYSTVVVITHDCGHINTNILRDMIVAGAEVGRDRAHPQSESPAWQILEADDSEATVYSVDVCLRTGRVVLVLLFGGLDDFGGNYPMPELEFVVRFLDVYPEASRAMVRPTLTVSERALINEGTFK